MYTPHLSHTHTQTHTITHTKQLFLGDTNRTISETPMNQASSRSHCVFTVSLEARRRGGGGGGALDARVRRSKLNLVDLAGSERVGKTGSEGAVLKEARWARGRTRRGGIAEQTAAAARVVLACPARPGVLRVRRMGAAQP
jgi:hypothetical protein